MRDVIARVSLVFACASCGPAPLPGDDAAEDDSGTTAPSDTGPGGLEVTTANPGTSTPDPSSTTTTTSTITSITGSADDQDEGNDPSEAEVTTADPGTESTSTGDPSDADVRAIALLGGLDRIRIFARDPVVGVCLVVTLVQPSVGQLPEIVTPLNWAVEGAVINDVPESCDTDKPFMFGGEGAVAGTGEITFHDMSPVSVFPCSLDVDVTLSFEPLLPVPASYTLSAIAVPVDGC